MSVWEARYEEVFDRWYVAELSESGEVLRIVADDLPEADAHLIAASPRLLQACEVWVETIEHNYPDPDGFERTTWQYRKIEEAVDAAEGKSID